MAGMYHRLNRAMKRSVGTRGLGLLDQTDDAGDRVVLLGLGDPDLEGSLGVDRSGEDRVTRAFRLGHAFPCHGAFVDA
jgi:hypothetical protein